MSSEMTRQEFLELCEEGPNGGDYVDDFDAYLDDTYGAIEVAGIDFRASQILEELDPIAYNEEWNNWVDGVADDYPEGVKCEPCGLWVVDLDDHTEYEHEEEENNG